MSVLLVVRGHCYSKKNSRPIFKRGSRLFPGKSEQLERYERTAAVDLRRQWGIRRTLKGSAFVRLTYYYRGQTPDALGFAETIFDAIEAAGIVEDDVQLVPVGSPAISRIHAVHKDGERVEIEIEGAS